MATEKWDRALLREICDSVNYGYTASANQEPIGPKFLRITDIVPDQIDWSSVPYCKTNKKNLSKYQLEKGDIVIARTGATTGYAKRIRDNYNAVFASYLVRIRVNPKYDNRYVGFVVESDEYKQFVQLNIGGTAQPHANAQVLTSFPVPLPPLSTQRKIAAILSPYDDLIENNTRRIQILEEMARTIYRQWFVEFQFPGHETVPMVESELGMIPRGWEIGELGDLAESVRRNIKPSNVNRETPYFGLEHLPRKSIALSNWDSVDSINSTKLAFKKGEILFGKIRPYLHKVGVAPLDGICSSDTIVIRPKRDEYFAITLSYVSSEHFVEYATVTSQGTTMPRADWKVLVKYPVVIPPDQITQRFSRFVRDVIPTIQNLIFRNINLRQTRDLLLPKLISGELDVSELDINIEGIQPSKGGTPIPYPLTDRLHSDEKILGGKPVIRGTRLAVAFILELLENGWSEEEVLENYSNIKREDIDACLAYQQQGTDASVRR